MQVLLICIQPVKWNDDYSPWHAAPLLDRAEPFGRGALAYLNFVSETVKPYVDAQYRTKPESVNTALLGYSLGGLAALYALYYNSAFGRIGSLSGALWFDGWTEFMESNIPLNTDAKVYLSLGNGEERSRNQRMGKAGDCTRKAAEILSHQLKLADNQALEWNTGGHFIEIPQRHIKALLWLMQIQ
jgi:predicted alpha/beta superfamily hydrolase